MAISRHDPLAALLAGPLPGGGLRAVGQGRGAGRTLICTRLFMR
ncbi:hypothetical protein ACKI1J_06180 [Streptomyces scabiei]